MTTEIMETTKLSSLIRRSITNYPTSIRNCFYLDGAICAMGGAILEYWQNEDDPEFNANNICLADQSDYFWEAEAKRVIRKIGLESIRANCPECDGIIIMNNLRLFYIITHLNDTHEWSREQIADWLEEWGF